VVTGHLTVGLGRRADVAGAVGESFLVLERAPGLEDGERSLVEDDGVVLARLAVGLDDELMVHAGDGPGQCSGSLLEIDVLPPESEVGAAAVTGSGDECPCDPVPVLVRSCPGEESPSLVSGPHRADDLRLGLSWRAGVAGDVVVDEAEFDCVFERTADDGVDVPNGPHSQVSLVLRGLLRAPHDRGDGVFREWLVIGELVGEGLCDLSVAHSLLPEVGDAGIDLRIVSPVRRLVDSYLLLQQILVQVVEVDRPELLLTAQPVTAMAAPAMIMRAPATW